MNAEVTIDLGLCQGHGQCQESAPEIFEVRDDGLSYVIGKVDTPVLLEKTKDGAARCPVDAIIVDT